MFPEMYNIFHVFFKENRPKYSLFIRLQNNKKVKKIKFASYFNPRDYSYKHFGVFSSSFPFFLEGNISSTHVSTLTCVLICTHTNIENPSYMSPHSPLSCSHTSSIPSPCPQTPISTHSHTLIPSHTSSKNI